MECTFFRVFEKDGMIKVADFLLRTFIRRAADIFGNEFVTYYVHYRTLPFSYRMPHHAALSNFSAFKYDNYLGIIKRCLRLTYMSLQQLYNRDFERGSRLMQKDMIDEEYIELRRERNEKGHEIEVYSKFTFQGITLFISEADCCFQSKNGEVVVLSKITCPFPSTQISLCGHRFRNICNFFTFPIDFTDIGIFKVSELEEAENIWFIKQVLQEMHSHSCR